MKMVCCGVVYSTNDPETFWCIEVYGMSIFSKFIVGGEKVEKELVYSLRCKKNGCTKIEIHRFGREGVLLEAEKLNGKKARCFLEKTAAVRYRIKQKYPLIREYSTKIPLVYGKAVNGLTQKARYITEEGWADMGKIYSPVRAYRLEN